MLPVRHVSLLVRTDTTARAVSMKLTANIRQPLLMT